LTEQHIFQGSKSKSGSYLFLVFKTWLDFPFTRINQY